MRTAKVTILAGCLALFTAACEGGEQVEEPADAGTDADEGDAGAGAVADVFEHEAWPDLLPAPTAELVASGLSGPCSLALGGDGLIVGEEGAGRLSTFAVGDAAAAKPRDLAPGLGGATRLVLHGDDIFVTQRAAGRLVRLRGGMTTTLASGQANPNRLVVKDGFVTWVAEGAAAADGAIRRVSVDGGDILEIAKELQAPRGLSVTSNRVYVALAGSRYVVYFPLSEGGMWTGAGDKQGNTPVDIIADEATNEVFYTSAGPVPGGFIHRLDLNLQGDTRLTESPPQATWMALDAERVYWVGRQTVSYTRRSGGAYKDLAVHSAACDLAVGGGFVYWSEPSTGRIWRVATPK